MCHILLMGKKAFLATLGEGTSSVHGHEAGMLVRKSIEPPAKERKTREEKKWLEIITAACKQIHRNLFLLKATYPH